MNDVPVQVLIAAFQDEKSAEQVLKQLKEAQREKFIGIQDAAVLRRDAKNKLHIKEVGMNTGKGTAIGAVAGGVIGLLAGPVVLVGAAGALIGGLAAKLRDTGFADERLAQIGASLKPGTSAIIAVIEHKWVAEVEQILAEEATDIMVRELSADIAQQLEAGREVAYTALAMQDAYSAGRMSVGEDSVEISGLTITEEGLVAVDAVLEAVDETEALPAGEDAEQV